MVGPGVAGTLLLLPARNFASSVTFVTAGVLLLRCASVMLEGAHGSFIQRKGFY